MEILLLILWLGCGFGAMAVANQRGGSACGGLALGFLLGPIGLVLALAIFEGTKCPKCQQTIPAKAERCPKCQADLSPTRPEGDREVRALVSSLEKSGISGVGVISNSPSVVVPATTKKCPDCAEEVKAEARKCRFCGFQFDAEGGRR